MSQLDWISFGQVPYGDALARQHACASRVAKGGNPVMMFMEHPPTVTMGRHGDRSHLLYSDAEYRARGIARYDVKRGGDVTCHGPGQLVGYPIVSLRALRLRVPDFVQTVCNAIVLFLRSRGVPARWSQVRPGVWVEEDKIAAVGFHVSKGVSTHGFAMNLDPDLSLFDTIVPCGCTDSGVTSLARLGVEVPDLNSAADEILQLVADGLGLRPGTRFAAGHWRQKGCLGGVA